MNSEPVPPTKKRGRPKNSQKKQREMREKIMRSTQRLFKAEGYRQISMRRIADDVGCAPMTLYKYYANKTEILYTLWSDIFGSLFNTLNTAELAHKPSNEQLALLAEHYVKYWLDNSEHYRLVFMTEGIQQLDVNVFMENPEIGTHYQTFAVAITNASQKQLTNEETMRRLNALICFLHGIAHNLITISGHDWPPLKYLINTAIRGVLND